MTWLRKPLLPHILTGVLAAWMLAVIPLAPTHAQIWSEYAMVSATLGVSDSRICIGEASRGDIGCPAYAPYVAPNGWVGIGTSSPVATLNVSGSVRITSGSMIASAASTTLAVKGYDDFGSIEAYGAGTDYLTKRPIIFNRWGGNVGIAGINIPSSTLHVGGAIRLKWETSTTLNTCDANRTGAIKYESGDFYYCRNGTAWESLSSLSGGGGAAGDRITSGTTGMYTYEAGKASLATEGVERVVVNGAGEVGIGQQPVSGTAVSISGSGLSLTNLNTDPSKTVAYMSITASGNIGSGWNVYGPTYDAPWAAPSTVELAAYSSAKALQFRTSRTGYAAPFIFKMGSTGATPAMEVARITSTGLALGIITPTVKIEVSGTISATAVTINTTVNMRNNPSATCVSSTLGAVTQINSKLYFCRP